MARTRIKEFINLDDQTASIFIGIYPDSRDQEGISNEKKAIDLEFGTDKAPARPFFSNSIEDIANDDDIKQSLIADNYDKAGLKSIKIIQNNMDNGQYIPLANYTINQRKKRGNNSIQPTVDTGSLKKSFTYEIE